MKIDVSRDEEIRIMQPRVKITEREKESNYRARIMYTPTYDYTTIM